MEATCYDIDGKPFMIDTMTYLPCNWTALANNKHSACCAQNDLCLDNGLCLTPADRENRLNYYWQEGCTDATWEDEVCPKYCPADNTSYVSRENNRLVLKCIGTGTPWCCAPTDFVFQDRVQTECCTVSSLIFEAGEPLVHATARLTEIPQISSSSSSIAADTTPASQPQPQPSTRGSGTSSTAGPTTSSSTMIPATSSAGLSTGAKTGIGLGVSLLLVLGAAGWWWRRKKAGARDGQREQVGQANSGTYSPHGQNVVEIDGYTANGRPRAPVEMSAGETPMYPI